VDATEQLDEKFSQLGSLPDDRIDLVRGALLIAKTAYPDLDESQYLARFDRMAAEIMKDTAADSPPADMIPAINRYLFDEEKFQGNRENYYDPENSFLNRVLDRKLGIPITLSMVYIEVAKRLGLDMRGIGLPGHFLTALYHASGRIFIDPFYRGEMRTVDECLAIVRTHAGEAGALDPGWLEPVARKEFLARMLRNLKNIYARTDNDVMLFRMVHWVLTLQPNAAVELRERALLYEAMGDPLRAVKDWQRYISRIQDPDSKKQVRERIDYLKKQTPRIQ